MSELSSKKRYPGRPPRIQLFADVRPFYFITFNTAHRKRILDNGLVHQSFLDFAEQGYQSHNVAVGRYVFMPDHVHLFVLLPDRGIALQGWMKALKTVLGKALADQGISRPHWQPGFFDHVLRSSDSYGEKWQYAAMNPVRAGLCEKPEDWPWQGEIVRLSA
jgi:REP element-mobilizing transposase RayT